MHEVKQLVTGGPLLGGALKTYQGKIHLLHHQLQVICCEIASGTRKIGVCSLKFVSNSGFLLHFFFWGGGGGGIKGRGVKGGKVH